MIDWTFIGGLEGGQRLRGYVPAACADGDRSGVTIATGIDLGRYTALDRAGLDASLNRKLDGYIGLTGERARSHLAKFPLTVTKNEADMIEAPKRRELIVALSSHFQCGAAHSFEQIPDAAQTILMSVTWQYGTPWVRTPKFWSACCRRDWPAVIALLRDFGDPYPRRRALEADYLEKHLSQQTRAS